MEGIGDACAAGGKRGVRVDCGIPPGARLLGLPPLRPILEVCMSAARVGDMRPGNAGGGWNCCRIPGGIWPGTPVLGLST